ncbi:AEC family transporter [Vannielia litorea]|uniref:AEC family transporter n=1 Tax=Vannielia litorea TaxID=1217970 RepID=UPI001BCD31B7
MSFLTVLANPILPVFAILALGWGLGKGGQLSEDSARTINRFAMTVLVPIVVLDLLWNAPFDTFRLTPILLYSAAQVILFALGYQLARRLFGAGPGESVILGYAGIFANNVFYGLPIGVLLYGESGVLPITMVVVLDSTVSFGGTMFVLQAIKLGRVSPGAVLAIFARTPTLLAIFGGTALGLAGVPVPAPVQTFLDFNGVAAAPVALFSLGVVLSAVAFRFDTAVAVVSGIKLVVFPALVALLLTLFAGGWEANRLFVFAAAPPTGAMAMSLALLYDVPAARVAQVMVWTAFLSLFALAVLA